MSSSIFFSKKSADAWKLAKRSNCPVSAISNCAPKTSVPVEIPRPAKRSRSPHAVSSPSVLARSCASEWKPMRPAEQTITVLPDIPPKRYFAIGEVSELCEVKPHVLRYWEQEFPQLKPVKRRGNRRYYQQNDVQMVRRIRSLLYEQGFTISGARQRLKEMPRGNRHEIGRAHV